MIDSIIFDGEGVVIDTESIWDEGQRRFLRRRGLTYDREGIKPLLTGKSMTESTSVLKREYGLEGDVDTLARERIQIIKGLITRNVKFVRGFADFFEKVRDEYKTGLATAMTDELLDIAKKKLGLSRLFDDRIYTLADVGYRSKPEPDLFLFAAKQLGSEPQSCVVIEDSPFGIEAAARAGMRCFALTTTYAKESLARADVIVDSFDEISLFGIPSS